MHKLSIILLVCAAAGSAHANGFVLNDHGAAATGRANAVVATDIDGSAIVNNVAGIAAKDGINVYVGASFIFPKSSFTPEGSAKADTVSPTAITPQLFATARVSDLIAVGIGFHTPFGSKIVWPDDAPTTDELHQQALRSYFITPSVGVNLDKYLPGLTIGAGIDLVPATVELEQDIFFGQDVKGSAKLGGNAFGIGGRAGVEYRPRMLPQLSVGVAYRSKVKLDFSGKGDFDIPDPYRGQLPPDGDIKTSITLPQSVLGGVAYRPLPQVEVELDAVWMGWSSLKELDISLPGGMTTVSRRDYKNTLSIRFGGEYHLNHPALDLRAGYMYDPSPIPANRLTVALPDINRHDLAFGASYHVTDSYKVDFGALWVIPGSRKTDSMPFEPVYKGKFGVTAFVTSLTLSGRFGKTTKAAE